MTKILVVLTGIGVLSLVTPSVAAYPFRPYVRDAAVRYSIEEPLIRAIIKAESDFDPQAVSSKGAIGLMQLLPVTAQLHASWIAPSHLLDPVVNVDIGTRHLRHLNQRVRQRYPHAQGVERIRLIAAAYHAGWDRVATYGGIPPIKETRQYCLKVTQFYRAYGGKLSSSLSVPSSASRASMPQGAVNVASSSIKPPKVDPHQTAATIQTAVIPTEPTERPVARLVLTILLGNAAAVWFYHLTSKRGGNS